ncbi:MAG TPA: prepilin-type N-terminal cleavage/methylation domain-containing protein [Candidatus Omnitrophota bacterium]|nr:prepilin-type N-terminal cleavage/methylation domain-containing protein [Candidatus Omnitrophota bacterium]HPS36726.1 prepilin-type N-terminal cleavage/methylation domain-containing protein [Candidatus Omnitrophota bacterium]
MRKGTKGFTLIEVLIVVVIIAVLASLILPRMTSQTGRAVIAEGTQMLGVIRRAQITYADITNAAADTYVAAGDTLGGAASGSWAALGLAELPASSRYEYACASGVDATAASKNPGVAGSAGTCTATLYANGANKITISISRGTFTCAGYAAAQTEPNTSGCVGA